MRSKDAAAAGQDNFESGRWSRQAGGMTAFRSRKRSGSAVDVDSCLLPPVMARRISQFVTTDDENGHHQQQQKDDGAE